MIKIQIVPQIGIDAYKLIRDKVANEAKTWMWSNKTKTRLRRPKARAGGYIDVFAAKGIVAAQIVPGSEGAWFLTEKFVGRLIAWFPKELATINIQIFSEEGKGDARPIRRRKRI